jgi:hypothetical protein
VNEFFHVINMDGWNVGLRGYFAESYLEFDCYKDAVEVALHWDKFIRGEP